MSKATSVSESLTLSRVVGQNLSDLRTKRGLTVSEFATQMNDAMGRGWQRQEVYKYENGTRAMSAEELVAASLVLGCTVGDLVASTGPVEIGARTVPGHQLTDSLSRASVEIEGWARFREAQEALHDLRQAAARYINAIEYVRARARSSAPLRKRIRDEGARATALLRQELADTAELFETTAAERQLELNANATPAMIAASDALDASVGIERLAWLWRLRQHPAKNQTNREGSAR